MKATDPQTGHERCGGKTRSGRPCKLPAGHGTPHVGTGRCARHGGCTPSHIANAVEKQAKAAAERFGLSIRTTAAEALQDELDRSNGLCEYYRARLMELPPDELVYGREKQIVTVGTPPGQQWRAGQQGQPSIETTQSARPHVWLVLYERERKHLANVAIEMERIGLTSRLVRVSEQQAAELKRVMDYVFADPELGLTAEQQAKLPTVVPRHLRALGAGDA